MNKKQKILRNIGGKILSLSGVVATSLLLLDVNATEPLQIEQPNFVLILADDLGWRDLSCYESEFYETPNIDRLAASGIKFTDAYAACSVCSPTRAALLTGKYPARLHFTHIIQAKGNWPKDSSITEPDWCNYLPLSEKTIPEILKKRGYRSAHIGKWHLGGSYEKGKTDTPEANPLQQGFDVNIAGNVHGQPPDYFSPYKRHYSKKNRTYQLAHMPPGKKGDYLTDVLTEQALSFIDKQGKKPFFLYLSLFTPHTSMGDRLQAKQKIIEKYKRKLANNPDTPQKNPVYAAMIEHMDKAVGRVLQKLKDQGIDKNTLVIFLSDNGGLSRKTSNLPLRSGKGSCYEGGIRIPMILSWPGRIRKGQVCDVPVITPDVFPTIIELACIKSKINSSLDGQSLVPLFTDKSTWTPRPIFWHFPHYRHSLPPHSIVRKGNYKLIEFLEDGKVELFDLKNDLREKNNLATGEPKKVEELRSILNKWRKKVNAQIPQKKKIL